MPKPKRSPLEIVRDLTDVQRLLAHYREHGPHAAPQVIRVLEQLEREIVSELVEQTE